MKHRAIPRDELFDDALLQSIRHLKFIARRVPRGGRWAEQRSVDLGSGIEFRDFRPYSPGDDFRSIDWNIYRRLGRVFVRLLEELEALPLYLLVDASDSSFTESPPRAKAGLRAALVLSAISLNQHDTVGIYPFASQLTPLIRPQAGKNRVLTFTDRLAQVEPAGVTDMVRCLQTFRSMRQRPGLVAIISDFFDPNGIEPVLEELGRFQHRLLFVQLVRETDRNPDVQGDLRLVDCESGAAEDVSVTSNVVEKYRQAYSRFEDQITRFAKRRGAGLVRLDVEREVVPQLASLFETGSYSI